MVSIKIEAWESHVLSSIPLKKWRVVTIIADSVLIIVDITLQASVLCISISHHAHSLKKIVLVVHAGNQLKSKLYLLECVSDFGSTGSVT